MTPIPSIAKQQEIKDVIDVCTNKIAIEEDRKTSLKTLFNSLLHHLMTGKVRVRIQSGEDPEMDGLG